MSNFSLDTFCRADNKYIKRIANIFNVLISLFLFITIILLIFYIAYSIYEIFLSVYNFKFWHFVHNTVFIIVLVKVYKILLSYFKSHHISIRYIVEISIIAPAIEVVLANEMHDKFNLIMLSLFWLTALFIYLKFYEKIITIDKEKD